MTSIDLQELIDRLESLAAEIDSFDPHVRDTVVELLDAIELLHRVAVSELGVALGDRVDDLREEHPAIAWLFDAYDVAPLEEAASAERDTLPLYPG